MSMVYWVTPYLPSPIAFTEQFIQISLNFSDTTAAVDFSIYGHYFRGFICILKLLTTTPILLTLMAMLAIIGVNLMSNVG